MVTKTWNGASADYSVASDWVPQGTPGPGDIADITAGTVTASGGTIAAGTTVNVSSGAAATALLLTDAFVAHGTRLNETAGAANVVLGVTGTVTSQGAVNFTQSGSGNDILGLNDAPGGASSFVNNGGFSSTDAISVIQNLGNASNQFVNNGIISARTSGTTQKLLYVTAPIGGTGLIRVDANETLLPTASVGAGQTVLLEPGVGGASFLQLADAAVFGATIVGFGSADRIQLTSPSFDNATITAANGVSTLS